MRYVPAAILACRISISKQCVHCDYLRQMREKLRNNKRQLPNELLVCDELGLFLKHPCYELLDLPRGLDVQMKHPALAVLIDVNARSGW